jgi:hypothetical protein
LQRGIGFGQDAASLEFASVFKQYKQGGLSVIGGGARLPGTDRGVRCGGQA